MLPNAKEIFSTYGISSLKIIWIFSVFGGITYFVRRWVGLVIVFLYVNVWFHYSLLLSQWDMYKYNLTLDIYL